MKYKIKVDVVDKICYQFGLLIEEQQEKQYLEKLIFSEEEIKLGYQIIELEEDIYDYITQTLEPIIDKGLKRHKLNNIEHLILTPPQCILEVYDKYYEEIL